MGAAVNECVMPAGVLGLERAQGGGAESGACLISIIKAGGCGTW